MHIKTVASIAAILALPVFSGCQHVAPEPLDLTVVHAERPLDIAPVQAYAAALAAMDSTTDRDFDLSDGLSLREGEAVALWYNLDLRIARLEAMRADASADAAGRWADPELGFETGEKSTDEAGTAFLQDAGETVKSWINAGSISVTLPLSGRLRAEKQLARTQHDVALLRAAEAEWDTLFLLRIAWTDWSVAVERAALLETQLSELDHFSEVAESLADAGELSPSSARLFQIERLRMQASRDHAKYHATESRVRLLQLLGLLPDAPVDLVPEIVSETPKLAEEPNFEQHPRMTRLMAEYQATEDRLRLELRRQYPDLTISPTIADEDDETALLLGMGLPIPVWNANRQGIADAVGARAVMRAQAEAGYQQLIAEAAQAEAAHAASRARRMQLAREVAPEVDAQMKEVLALLDIGELDFTVLYQALEQALETKEELLSAAHAEAIAAARLRAAHTVGAIKFDATTEDEL